MAKSVANLFRSTSHAAIYSKYRFTTPTSVISRIIEYLGEEIKPPFTVALDVGCGTGQSTRFLTSYFKEIIGIDVSEAQVKEAQKEALPNITYKVGTSETIPMKDKTVQLITGSQCHHWFDLPAFYKEVNRVLVPNGVLCFYFYSLPRPAVQNDNARTTKLQEILDHAYRVDSKPYWDVRRQLVDKGFDGISDFPFRNIVRENVFEESDSTLADYLGYVTSWSAFQVMKREDPMKANTFIEKLEIDMVNAMGGNQPANKINIKLHLNYFIVMGRSKYVPGNLN